ncbi:MAG: hypothetical protein O3A55_01165 [Bacteroidetes bacterium]|nr:hypothetical protein [Bacteroidota bacterium]
MKKFLSVLVLFIYALTSVGYVVTTHFCGLEVSSVSLHNFNKSCGCEEPITKDDCCKDQFKNFKIDSEQKKSNEFIFYSNENLISTSKINFSTAVNKNFTPLNFLSNLIKDKNKLELNCTFLI